MTNSPQLPSVVCTHERRPGTTLCLHCRRATRLQARARRKQVFLRGVVSVVVIGGIGAVGVAGATAIHRRGLSRDGAQPAQKVMLDAQSAAILDGRSTQPASDVAAPAGIAPDSAPMVAGSSSMVSVAAAATPPVTVAASHPVPVASSPASTSTIAGPTSSARVATVSAPTAPLAPILSQGETVLPEGVVALRTDSTVTLSFDTPGTRTRVPEKFERFLRTTLPEVYGQALDSALARVPDGDIARQGNLVAELPSRGIRIPVRDAWTLAVYPVTRPGQDGPLVVRYRVTVVAKDRAF